MNIEKIIQAEKEARLFLERAKLVRDKTANYSHVFFGSKETASLRRQSMELSNALVELRKPG